MGAQKATVKYHYSGRRFTHRIMWGRRSLTPVGYSSFGGLTLPFREISAVLLHDPLLRDNGQTGSLAGAAFLLNDNAGVLKPDSVRTEISRGA